MKTINKIIVLLGLVAFFLVGCEKTTDNVSKITTFAVITITGDAVVWLETGTAWTDPGATSSGGETIITDNPVDVNVPGIYSVTYSAENTDGFKASAVRTVIVADKGDDTKDLAGTYTGSFLRSGTGVVYETPGITFIQTPIAGIYQVFDLFAGYYESGRGYGAAYRAPGYMTYAGGDSVLLRPQVADPWGYPLEGVGYIQANGDIELMMYEDGAGGYAWDQPFKFLK
jgi:hypothetical protein